MKEQLQFRLHDLSTYRSELMGWSILWIMMLHFTFTQLKPLGFIAQYGFSGVEIFMFVSGFGLFYSLEKDNNATRFYSKRLLRIFPTYYIIGIFTSLFVFHDNLLTYLFRYTTLGFWTEGTYSEWYIPSIVFLYLLAPWLKKIFTSHWLIYLMAVACISLLATAYCLVERNDIIDNDHYFLLYRIPAFLFGMLCAYWIKNGVNTRYYFVIMLLAIPFFIWLFPQHHIVYRYKYLSLFFMMPFFIHSFCTISKLFPIIKPVISKMGTASLEIYIIQQIFFCAIITDRLVVPEQWHDTLTLFLIVTSTSLGLFAHWLFKKAGL